MDTETVTLLFAGLALAAQAIVAGVVVAALTGYLDRLRSAFGSVTLAAGAVVAATCTVGSLYLSEVAEFPPCRLCWFQRIAMYPLVVLLGLAAWRRDHTIRLYGAVLAVLGSAVSIWHLFVERFPSLEGDSCDPLNPCSIIWVERFGFLTIPGMALSGFALVIALLAVSPPASQ